MSFPVRDVAQYLGAFVLAPTIVFVGLLILDGATRGWQFAADPEGIAYLMAFTFMALPGLLVGLLCSGYVLRSFAEFGILMKLGLASLAGTVGSCIGSGLVILLVARSLGIREFFPGLLILPVSLGIVGGFLLTLFSWRRDARNA